MVAKKKGRPTAFKKQYKEQVVKLAALGATDKQMAEFFGVTEQTLNNWKKKHEDFFESLKDGKQVADTKVQDSLFKRACGFTRTIERVTKDGDVVETKEEVLPDTTACIFWLKNRRPEQWRDKHNIEHSGEVKSSPSEIVDRPPRPTREEWLKEYDQKQVH